MKGEIKMKTLFLFLASSVLASDIVIYNPNDSLVVNRVIQYSVSVHTPDYNSIINKVINPDMSIVKNINRLYWKVSGKQVIEMNVIEKQIINTYISNQNELRKDIDNSDKLSKSVFLVIFDQINSLRVKAGLAAITLEQFKKAVKDKYNNL